MKQRMWMTMAAVALVGLLAAAAQAVTIDLVPVGNLGNLDDNTGYGAVDYFYEIGRYEVTNAQWREFLNAKAAVGDPYGLYNARMAGSNDGGIARRGSGTSADPWVYYPKGNDANWNNRPVNYVSFWDAARFCNWLHNDQGSGDTETGAYMNIDHQDTFARGDDATWVIPTEDEWYKAAYHKNDGMTGNYFDYPTSSNHAPNNDAYGSDGGNNANYYVNRFSIGYPYYTTKVGEFEKSDSPYGTFDQGGNLFEWNETSIAGSSRGFRGGDYAGLSFDLAASTRAYNSPTFENGSVGFRVARVPEPGSITLLLCGATAGLMWWKRRR